MTTYNVPLTAAVKSFLDLSTVLSRLSDFHFWIHSAVRLTSWLFIEAHTGIQNLLSFYTDSFQNQLELVAALSLCAKGISRALAQLNLPLNVHSTFRQEWALSPPSRGLFSTWTAVDNRWQIITRTASNFVRKEKVIIQLSLTVGKRPLGIWSMLCF